MLPSEQPRPRGSVSWGNGPRCCAALGAVVWVLGGEHLRGSRASLGPGGRPACTLDIWAAGAGICAGPLSLVTDKKPELEFCPEPSGMMLHVFLSVGNMERHSWSRGAHGGCWGWEWGFTNLRGPWVSLSLCPPSTTKPHRGGVGAGHDLEGGDDLHGSPGGSLVSDRQSTVSVWVRAHSVKEWREHTMCVCVHFRHA